MKKILSIVLSIFALTACDSTPSIQKITGAAQGTTYSVSYWSKNNADKAQLTQAINKELARIDKVMSNWRKDSDIEMFNRNKVAHKALKVHQEIIHVLNISKEVHEKSNGCFDPTIGPLFSIWGFKKKNFQIPTAAQIKEKLKAVGFNKNIHIHNDSVTKHNKNIVVGLAAIGQGYAVAKISDILEKHNVKNYLTEIGGEMLVAGKKPDGSLWRVGVERPIPNSEKVNEVITLTGEKPIAIMTSGTYRHYYDKNGKRYSHIIDPRTGKPVSHNTVSVTVLLDDATYADAWSTALLCLGEKEALKTANKYNIPAVFYDINNKKITRYESNSTNQNNYWRIEK